MNIRLKRSKRAGMGSATVMLYMVGIATVGAGMLALASNIDKFGNRSRARLQAKTLAETALSQLYDQIRVQMRVDGSYPLSLDSQEFTDGTTTIGTYRGRVIRADMTMTDVDYSGTKVRRTEYSFLVEGQGQEAVTGIQSKLRSRFVGAIEHSLVARTTTTGSTADKIYFPMVGIGANDQVVLHNDTARVVLNSDDGKSAHLVANGGVVWSPIRTKSTITATDLVQVQGQIVVPQTAYDFTVGTGGLGNPNGTKQYDTPAIAATGSKAAVAADSVTKVGNNIRMADAAQADVWKDNWYQVSRGPTSQSYIGNNAAKTATPLNNDPGSPLDQYKIMRAPMYIEGDFDVSLLDKIAFMPTSSNPAQNVIYIKGNVRNLGKLKNLGCKVVIDGQYDDFPPGIYEVAPEGPYDTLSKAMNNSALLSVKESPTAMRFSGTDRSNVGLVYAVKGGIQVAALNAEYRGIMIAGGSGGNGKFEVLSVGGRDNAFTLHFDPDAGRAGDWDPNSSLTIDTSYIPAGVWAPFAADKLTNWVEVR